MLAGAGAAFSLVPTAGVACSFLSAAASALAVSPIAVSFSDIVSVVLLLRISNSLLVLLVSRIVAQACVSVQQQTAGVAQTLVCG